MAFIFGIVAVAITYFLTHIYKTTPVLMLVLSMGDREARSLGVHTERIKIGLIGPVAQALKKRVKELIITGSSTINGTVDSLLDMGRNAGAVALVGSSTPMYPAAWTDTNVKSLSGSWWKNEAKEDIFRTISRDGGIMELQPYMLKKAMPVE